jgi:hypothetical protein
MSTKGIPSQLRFGTNELKNEYLWSHFPFCEVFQNRQRNA